MTPRLVGALSNQDYWICTSASKNKGSLPVMIHYRPSSFRSLSFQSGAKLVQQKPWWTSSLQAVTVIVLIKKSLSADVKNLKGQIQPSWGGDLLGGGSYCPFDVMLSVWSSWAGPHAIRFIGQRTTSACTLLGSYVCFSASFPAGDKLHFRGANVVCRKLQITAAESCTSLFLIKPR